MGDVAHRIPLSKPRRRSWSPLSGAPKLGHFHPPLLASRRVFYQLHPQEVLRSWVSHFISSERWQSWRQVDKTRPGLLCLAVTWGPQHRAWRARSSQGRGLGTPGPRVLDPCPVPVLAASSENMLVRGESCPGPGRGGAWLWLAPAVRLALLSSRMGLWGPRGSRELGAALARTPTKPFPQPEDVQRDPRGAVLPSQVSMEPRARSRSRQESELPVLGGMQVSARSGLWPGLVFGARGTWPRGCREQPSAGFWKPGQFSQDLLPHTSWRQTLVGG